MSDYIRLRQTPLLDEPAQSWPVGTRLLPLPEVDSDALYDLLTAAYSSGFGTLPPRAEWWPGVVADSEFDPGLVFVAADGDGTPIGLALCWSSGFVKDLAVRQDWRGRGIGEALLCTAFAAFSARGLAQVDLKVMTANAPALRLYQRVGMVAVAD